MPFAVVMSYLVIQISQHLCSQSEDAVCNIGCFSQVWKGLSILMQAEHCLIKQTFLFVAFEPWCVLVCKFIRKIQHLSLFFCSKRQLGVMANPVMGC